MSVAVGQVNDPFGELRWCGFEELRRGAGDSVTVKQLSRERAAQFEEQRLSTLAQESPTDRPGERAAENRSFRLTEIPDSDDLKKIIYSIKFI